MSNEWDQFPAASPVDVALQVEGVTGKAADVARSIYEQESGSGKNTKTSNAGAVGGMQIVPATFKQVADKDWDINDPIHNARAGVRYVKMLDERGGGDPALTAAGYYGGPGGQDKAKRGIAVADPRNPNAPDTLQYGKQVAGRIPKGNAQGGAKPEPAAMNWDQFPAVDESASKPKVDASATSAPKRTLIEDLGRQLGLTVRAGVNGVAALPAMAADAVTGPVNAGLDAVQGAGNGFRFKSAGRSVDDLMTTAGLPKPENAQERVVQDMASSMAGAGSMVGAGKFLASTGGAVAKGVGETLAAGPKLQVASAATGAGASGVTRESGGGAGAQVAAGLAGSLAPGMFPAAVKATARGIIRGGEAGRQNIAKNLETFEAAGVQPTLGQVAGGKLQRAEALVAKTPGGAGVIASYADKQADDMASAVQRLSDELAPGANAMNAGEAISKGINAFKQGVKATQQKLYSNLDKHLPNDTPIQVTKTQEALATLNADIPGAPNISEFFKNAKMKGIDRALLADLDAAATAQVPAGMSSTGIAKTPGQLPYQAIKRLRTLVGNEIADNSLVSDVPRSKWQSLYGALSDDLGVAAAKVGPEAEKSWQWANQFTRGQMERLDQLSNIVAKDSPEKIFAAATTGTLEGDTIIKRVVNALPKQERREVAAAVLQRMGRATAGQQNAMGDAFSSETFLTNLSKLSPASRYTLFGRTDVKGIEEQIGKFANVAELRREGGKIFSNPSGTASTGAQLVNAAAIGSGITGSIAMGNPLPLAGALLTPVVGNVAARALTSPAITKFAAGQTTLRKGAEAAAVGATTRLNTASQPAPEPSQDVQLHEVDFDPFAQPAPNAARIELNGMAPALSREQEAAPQETGDEGDTIDPSATQGAAEADPAHAFTSESRPDGTLAIRGEPQALHATLIAAGIPARSIVRNAAGVMVGRSQAGRVQEAIARMGQPAPEDAATGAAPAEPVAENQPMTAAPAGQVDPGQAAPLMAGADPAAPAGEMAPDQIQLALAAPSPDGTPAVPALEPESNQAFAQAGQAPQAIISGSDEVAAVAPAPIDVAAHAAATSPHNERPEPTAAQQKAGNYALGHDRIAGMDVSIENPQGSTRRGVDPDGKPWETQMQHHYGYFKRTTANDGDKLDVFIKPGTPRDFAGPVFVIDQTDPGTGKLDEHKVVMGAASEDEAKAIYRSNYADDWQGMGSITRLPLPAFRAWAASGDKKHALGDLQAQRSEGPAMPAEDGAVGQLAAMDGAGAVRNEMANRIQRLHDAGEKDVANLMQQGHDKKQRMSAAPAELAAMREAAPDLAHHQIPQFEQVYTQLRGEGTKPAEAAARAGILAAVQSQGPAAGLSEKALAALQGELEKLPLDKAPAFAQRFTAALIEKGVLAPFDGSDRIGVMLESARDGAMHAMAESAYRSAETA